MRVLALVLVSAALGFQSDAISPAAVAKHIEQELTAARVPGAAIVVVSGDEIFAGSYGVADAEHQTAMTPATLLQAGSLTKLFTALGVAATLESRQLPYDTRLGQVMTGLGPQAATATFHQLLSQTSGLRDRSGDNGASDEAALAAAARGLGAADFILPAGLVFSYSNPGYALAGAGLEAIRKQPYADALHDTTLAPLGMTQSTLRLTQVAARPHAVGHRLDGASTIALRTPNNDTRIWPAGYLWTNAADMSRALSALVSRGAVAGQRGLPPSVIARVSTPHAPMPNIFVEGHYGYGLMIFRDRNTLMFEHGGTNAGFSSMLRVAPDRRFGIAILTNLDNAPLRRIAQSVMARALVLPEASIPVRQETPVSADELKELLGLYQNRGTAEVAVRDGRVVLSLDGGPAWPVTRIGEHRYLSRPKPEVAGPEFVLQSAAGNAPPYLHFALWAYAKQ
jgi:CubicO group peptidase (beta-lactamase class C family)